MDPSSLLDIEKRTGVKNTDIDDFLSKVTSVEDQIKGMMDGSIKPEDVLVDGEHTEAELVVIRAQKEKARGELAARREASAAEEKARERRKWWRGAELMRDDDAAGGGDDVVVIEGESFPKQAIRPYAHKDANDYSNWEKWVQRPDDPVSVGEMEVQQAKIDKVKDAQFEEANPAFCTQVVEDMAKRKESQLRKSRDAERQKELGNRLFRKRRFKEALARYEEALELAPWALPLLTNLAQCHIRLKQHADAIEYCNRALYLAADSTKALSRRAKARHAIGDLQCAVDDVVEALTFAPDDEDLKKELDRYQVRGGTLQP